MRYCERGMVNVSLVSPVFSPIEARTARNGRAILGAALRVIDEESWAALTPRHVSERAGLSRTAVLSRHPDRSALGVAVWRERIAEPLLNAWRDLVSYVDAGTDSAADLQRVMSPFTRPNDVMRTAAELIIVGRYDTEIFRAISETVGNELTNWTTPATPVVSPTLAAQRALTIGLAHGYLIEARRNRTLKVDLSREISKLAFALAHPSAPAELPTINAKHLDEPVKFDTDDPMVESVLKSTLELVGAVGFDATTIESICQHSGFTRSVIFNRYKTKRDLFVDATNQMLSEAVGLNDHYMSLIAQDHGVSIADACMLREFMRPGREAKVTVALEQLRISWHDLDVQAAIDLALIENQRRISQEVPISVGEVSAVFVTAAALGHGIVALANINPDIWQLPYDVVLVPFNHK